MSYSNPKAQIVSSHDAVSRKHRLDPSQYHAATELIIRSCKTHSIRLASLKESGYLKEVYLPNRFNRLYTKDLSAGVPMIGTSSMLNLRLPQDIRVFLRNVRNANSLYIKNGDILISRSGTIGTCTLCGESYEGFIASDDCIRLHVEEDFQGYVTAYMKSKYGQALIARDAHGKVIKHLKTDDIKLLKIMMFEDDEIKEINNKMISAKKLYDQSRLLLIRIDELLTECLEYILPKQLPESNFNIIASSSLRMNRLDPHLYDRVNNYILKEISRNDCRLLGDVATVWTVPRFKRNYLDRENPHAVPLYSSSDIVRANLSASKYISSKMNSRNINLCRVEKDCVLIPCSGAYGGILGKGILAGNLLDRQAMSQHIIRIKKQSDALDYFYVAAFLCSYKFGYPLITATRFGKDIPELDPEALRNTPVPKISVDLQKEIGCIFIRARDLQEEANLLENSAIRRIEYLYETATGYSDI